MSAFSESRGYSYGTRTLTFVCYLYGVFCACSVLLNSDNKNRHFRHCRILCSLRYQYGSFFKGILVDSRTLFVFCYSYRSFFKGILADSRTLFVFC